MNLLVRVLRQRADALPDLDPSEDAPFQWLSEMAADDELVGPLLRAAETDPVVSGELAGSFAGVARLEEWEEARETGAAEWAPPRARSEWVAIVPVPGRDYGLTLPEDRLSDRRISLFKRHGDAVRRLSVVVMPGERPSLELRVAGGECGFPYRGSCGGGTCENCSLVWVGRAGRPAGYACRCDDGPSSGFAEQLMEIDTDATEAVTAAPLARKSDYA